MELRHLIGPIMYRFKFLVDQLQLVHFLEGCTESLLGVDVFGFVVCGGLVLKLVAKTKLVFKDSSLVSLRFKANILSDPF